MNKGDVVRMTEAFKAKMRGACKPGQHVQEVVDGAGDSCYACSLEHVKEFGDCQGIVDGPTDYNACKPGEPGYDTAKIGPEVDVRWQPSRLRYAYSPDHLELV